MTSSTDSFASIKYSSRLMRLLARAALINHYYEEEFDLSFSSMILSFLAGDDPLSQWFKTYVKAAKIDVQKILEEHNVNWQILDDIAARQLPSEIQKASYRMTTSAARFLNTASQFRASLNQGDEEKPLDVRHLMAVYIYAPGGHERDIVRWGFDRKDWSISFLSQMRSMYPEELDFWKSLHQKVLHSEPELKDKN